MRGLIMSPVVSFSPFWRLCRGQSAPFEFEMRRMASKAHKTKILWRTKKKKKMACAAVGRCGGNWLAKVASAVLSFCAAVGLLLLPLWMLDHVEKHIQRATGRPAVYSVIITTGCATSWARLLGMFTKWWADITAIVTTHIYIPIIEPSYFLFFPKKKRRRITKNGVSIHASSLCFYYLYTELFLDFFLF